MRAIGLLTLIFFFQDWLVRRPVLYDRVRLGFMIFTLVWIGWYAQAQLSVVNVLAFLSALRTDFRWEYFLMAPLIFILWFATAASLLFWNRGAYCGWLCPFGALQELTNRIAKLLKIPQLKISFGVHQRLTALKYIVFMVLFGISLSALGTAEQAAEVEPFKTAYHPAVRTRVAVRSVRGSDDSIQSFRRTRILPLSVPVGRGDGDPGANAPV